MTAVARVLAHFDRISEAPAAIPRLRRFVLDLAVRGRLVEQDPSDEPASEILQVFRQAAPPAQEGSMRRAEVETDTDTQDLFRLPRSWTWCRLSEAGTIVAGGTPPSRDAANFAPSGTGIPWLTPADLGRQGILYVSHGARDLTPEGLRRSSATLMPRGSVLFSSRAPIGYTAIAANEISTNQGFKSIVPHLFECSRYIALYFRAFAPWINERASGTTFREVSAKVISRLPFPLPPLAEQRRIVAKVDELMALCDRLEAAQRERESRRDRLVSASLTRLNKPAKPAAWREHARFHLQHLSRMTTSRGHIRQLRQLTLNSAVTGRLVSQDPNDEPAAELVTRLKEAQAEACRREDLRARPQITKLTREELRFDFPASWELGSFDELFVIVSGVTKGQRISVSEAVVVPYLRVANVQRGQLDLALVKTIAVRRSDAERYALRRGDILMTEGGDWDKLGRAAIWREEVAGCIHQNHVFRVRAPSDELLPEWVATYVNSLVGRAFFEDASKQTTNLASINMTQLRGCPIPVPPLAEQRRIVAKVNELMTVCDRLEAQLDAGRAANSALLEAILRDALEPREALTMTSERA